MTNDTRSALFPSGRLLVVLADPLTHLISKGEVVPRYYNPGTVFRRVDFLLLNEDQPPLAVLGHMVGDGVEVRVHNMPPPSRLFWRSLGWRAPLMGEWLERCAQLASTCEGALVRAHGAGLNGLVANHIGMRLGLPVLISLHNLPRHIVAISLPDRLRQTAVAMLNERVLRAAGNVMAVYRAQLPYLKGLRVRNVDLIYNTVGSADLAVKRNYGAGSRLKILSVGRQFAGKDISALIQACARVEATDLTVVGDGSLHDQLKALAERVGIAHRTSFIPMMTNEELCRSLADFDLFATHNDFPGIPKAVMEPMLAGLPVVVNRNLGIDELNGAAMVVDNTADGYAGAIRALAASEETRRDVGTACRQRALALWDPVSTETQQSNLHKKLVNQK